MPVIPGTYSGRDEHTCQSTELSHFYEIRSIAKYSVLAILHLLGYPVGEVLLWTDTHGRLAWDSTRRGAH